ncbi:MAG: hypothetical protein JNM47_00475 [Hyphomonadaceae bacterium]|nr:hypothetical protein [Hyphomonadaceae bacterium]
MDERRGAIVSSAEYRRDLISLAFVGTELAKSNDFFLALRPLFIPIAQDLAPNYFEPPAFAQELQDRYGISVPEEVCGFLAGRLNKMGLIESVASTETSAIYKWKSPSALHSYDDAEVLQVIDALVDRLIEFRDEFPSLVFNEHQGAELLEMFIEHLKGTDTALEKALATLQNGDSAKSDLRGEKQIYKDEKSYFCARFIVHLKDASPTIYAWISRLSNAALVSEFVLSLRDPPSRVLNLRGQVVYLDAPLMMDLLGCSGKALADAASYTLKYLQASSAYIRILDHSVDELRGNLRAVLARGAQDRYGKSHDAMLRGETTELYLRSVLENAEDFIERAGVSIVTSRQTAYTSAQMAAFSQADEDGLAGRLLATYAGVNAPLASERDAKSVAHVARLRGFVRVPRFSEAKHILVTRSALLFHKTNEYLRQLNKLEAGAIGPVILADHVAAMVWLCVGDQERVEIDSKRLLLHADRMVRASPNVIATIRTRLNEVAPQNAQQFDALMQVPRHTQFALDLVGGSVARAQLWDPVEIYNEVRRDTASELTAEHRRKIRLERQAHQAAARSLKSGLTSVTEDKLKLEEELRRRDQADKSRFEAIQAGLVADRILFEAVIRVIGICLAVIWLVAVIALGVINEEIRWAKAVEFVAGLSSGPLAVLLGFCGRDSIRAIAERYWTGRLEARLKAVGLERFAHHAG